MKLLVINLKEQIGYSAYVVDGITEDGSIVYNIETNKKYDLFQTYFIPKFLVLC